MKPTDKQFNLFRRAFDKASSDAEKLAALKALEKQGVESYDFVSPAGVAHESGPSKPFPTPQRKPKPQFSLVPEVLPFKTPRARQNAWLRWEAIFSEYQQCDKERLAMSDQGRFRSDESIAMHWRMVRLCERLIITAMQAGVAKVAIAGRTDLRALQNDLLRASGWPSDPPSPTSPTPPPPVPRPPPAPAQIPSRAPQSSHGCLAWGLIGICLTLILIASVPRKPGQTAAMPSPTTTVMRAIPVATATPLVAAKKKQNNRREQRKQ